MKKKRRKRGSVRRNEGNEERLKRIRGDKIMKLGNKKKKQIERKNKKGDKNWEI